MNLLLEEKEMDLLKKRKYLFEKRDACISQSVDYRLFNIEIIENTKYLERVRNEQKIIRLRGRKGLSRTKIF